MVTTRDLLTKSMHVTGSTAASSLPASEIVAGATTHPQKENNALSFGYRTGKRFGLGGVGAGNGFHVNSDREIRNTLEAAWTAGVRYYDTSPWYGLGLSERRFGNFLYNKKREDFLLSTKVGRILHPDSDSKNPTIWKGKVAFNYEYDYSAEATRRSIEDSLQRLGLPSIDIVFIHDLSPDNGDMPGDQWLEYFEQARNGAMAELSRMRVEGLINAWGMGVNTLEPALKCMEVADPNILLSATQYNLMHHKDALNKLYPACKKAGVSVVNGAPLAAGFLAGKDRYLYDGTIPDGFMEKREQMSEVAENHGVELRTAALQFAVAPEAVTAVIPGASRPEQVNENVASMNTDIPDDFWKELKAEKLIAVESPETGSIV